MNTTWAEDHSLTTYDAYDYKKYMPMSESEWSEENPDGDYTEYEFNRVNEILDELFVEYSMPKDTADDDE